MYNTKLGIGELSVYSRRNSRTDGQIREMGQEVVY